MEPARRGLVAMMPATATSGRIRNDVRDGIVERIECGIPVLTPSSGRVSRRVLYLNSYGGSGILERIKNGDLPPHHLWGCFELARLGYEVGLADPLSHFEIRSPFPHDLKLLRLIRSWLPSDGIIYCAHTLLFWLPLLRAAKLLNRRIVSLTFARERLDFSRAHAGIIAMTGAAADQARKMAPFTPLAHLGWGVDLAAFPRHEYKPEWFLSCGQTGRDHRTLSQTTIRSDRLFHVISPNLPTDVAWGRTVQTITGGDRDNSVTYSELFTRYYARCAAALIVLREDLKEQTANGFTSLLEAMAMARPVIITRTNALPTEIDVEKSGCGIYVPPNDPDALTDAIRFIANNPDKAEAMGEAGYRLCTSHYNIVRYGKDLHTFFESL
jgi:hypothetical protein